MNTVTLKELKTFPERERLVLDQNHWIEDRANLFANDNATCIIVSGDRVKFFCTMVKEDTTWIEIPFAHFIKCDSKEKVIAYWEKEKHSIDKKLRSIATELLEDFRGEENEDES